ncbi:MAG: NFACT family protein [Oscillospiraceae bacterium]|nr:NFACT family protein [Oscillospiraceae bacterium]
MAFDAYFLSAVLKEIREKAIGSRVEKIHQPSRDTILLLLKCAGGREKLLLAANPASPRLQLTSESPENPAEPPMFCMLLRKHLTGARLSSVTQPPMERLAVFTFDCIDELGDPVQKKLIAELMGRTCNIYLLGGDDRIIDCLRRIGIDDHIKRPALPGLYYQQPEPVGKADPRILNGEDYTHLLSAPGADLLCDRLMDSLGGLSPLVCREAALYAAGDTQARLENGDILTISQKLADFFQKNLDFPQPYYMTDREGIPKQYAFCPIYQYGDCKIAPSFGSLLDACYTLRDRRDAMRQKGQAIRKTVSNLLSRTVRKIAVQEKELSATYDRERLRQLGDIVTANLHRISRGQTILTAEDFYDEEMKKIDIPLSPLLSPQQNAARFYKDYTRMKNAEKELTHQIQLGQQEIQYLRSVLEELDRAQTDSELEEIRRELQDGGYLRRDSGRKKMKQGKLPPLRFESTDGYPIYVGRNNRQNEELTFRLARKDDIWLHAQKVHGSHVIISCGGTQPPDDTVTQAAQLAAYYAETAGGQNIPVDVTPVKQVKKPPNAKPGMVIYHTYRTVIVNPYKDIVVDALNAENKTNMEE